MSSDTIGSPDTLGESLDESPLPDSAGPNPELTPLGKRLELLRIERGLSKQTLAANAKTSRQQLWRVMTGKSELTTPLCQRLADALGIDVRFLRDCETLLHELGFYDADRAAAAAGAGGAQPAPLARVAPERGFAAYLADPREPARTLATLPNDADGRELKIQLFEAVSRLASRARIDLPTSWSEARARLS